VRLRSKEKKSRRYKTGYVANPPHRKKRKVSGKVQVVKVLFLTCGCGEDTRGVCRRGGGGGGGGTVTQKKKKKTSGIVELQKKILTIM